MYEAVRMVLLAIWVALVVGSAGGVVYSVKREEAHSAWIFAATFVMACLVTTILAWRVV